MNNQLGTLKTIDGQEYAILGQRQMPDWSTLVAITPEIAEELRVATTQPEWVPCSEAQDGCFKWSIPIRFRPIRLLRVS